MGKHNSKNVLITVAVISVLLLVVLNITSTAAISSSSLSFLHHYRDIVLHVLLQSHCLVLYLSLSSGPPGNIK